MNIIKWGAKVVIPIVYFFVSLSLSTIMTFPCYVGLSLSLICSLWVYFIVSALISYYVFTRRDSSGNELSRLKEYLKEHIDK